MKHLYCYRFSLPVLLAVLCGIIAGQCFATGNDSLIYSIRHYTDEDGLPQNSIRAIRQDTNGFIWLATEDGLTRFDGNNFVVYNTVNTSVSSNRFIDIQNGIYGSELYGFNINHEHLRIADGKAGRDRPYSIFYEKLVPFLVNIGLLPAPGKTPGQNDYTFSAGDHSFYIYLNHTLFYFHNDALVFALPFFSPDDEKSRFFLAGNTLCHLDSRGNVSLLESTGQRTVAFKGDILKNSFFAAHRGQARIFANDSRPAILLGHSLYTVEMQEDGNLLTKSIVEDFDFDANNITAAYYDKQRGMVFLGSYTIGLFTLRKKHFRTQTINNHGHNRNDYYAQAAYDSSTVITPQGNLIGDKLLTRSKVNNGWYNQYTILADNRGFIWQAGPSLRRYTHDFRPVWEWKGAGRDIIVLYQGPTGTIWIGMRDGRIYHYDPGTEREPRLLPVRIHGISYILQEAENKLWLASAYGLFCLNTGNMHTDTISGLNNKYLRSLYLSKPGELWITTYENGIYLYTQEKLVHFPVDDEQYLNAAHCIVEDKNGFFWITTNKGLFQVLKNDLLAYASGKQQDIFYLYYGKSNGFNTNEFNGGCEPCGIKLANGYISLPTLDGIVSFAAGDIKAELPDKKIFIDKIVLNDRNIPVSDNIELRQHFDQLNISVSSPYFGERKNVHMYYELGEDDQKTSYMPVPPTGIISLQNLSSGKYTLTVCKINGFGNNNYVKKTITITVPPYWYQSGWFYACIVLLLLLAVYLFISLRTRFLINKNRMLEIIIRKRTHNLEQALHSLETSQSAQAKQTYIQERLVAAISHDIRTPLKYLSFSNRKLYERLKTEGAGDELLEISKSAAEAANRMHHYLGNLLQYIKTSLQKGDIKADVFNLHDLVNEHIAMFANVAATNGTKIRNSIGKEQELYTNRQLLAIILHNILDNAVKNTFSGEINITAVVHNAAITIIIADNGSGIPAALQDWINSPDSSFDLADNNGNPSVNAGMGLFIVKELSALVKARLYIESDNRTGTAVQITLSI